MIIINILEDGTIFPPLRKHDLIIKIMQGRVHVGQFSRHRFITKTDNYLNEPVNAADLKADALAYINAEMPGLFRKKQTIYIICPAKISAKAEWEFTQAFNNS